MASVADTLLKILVGLGGLSGIAALLDVPARVKKMRADSGKSKAEANSITATAQSAESARMVSLIAPYERVHARMAAELDDLYSEVDRLKEYIGTLAGALRTAGVPVPPMPAKQPSTRGTDGLADPV